MVNLDKLLSVLWGMSAIMHLIIGDFGDTMLCICLVIAHYRLYKGEL